MSPEQTSVAPIDLEQAERIAVLETKMDALHTDVKELTALLKPMAALYQAGKLVLWLGGAVLSFIHWDQVVAYFHYLTSSPKH